MTWAKIDDNLPENPKVAPLSVAARWAYVASICYASRNLTDGFIPRSKLGSVDATAKLAVALVAARLWEPVDGGWVIHDYLEHNRSREKATKVSAERSAAGQISAAKRQQIVGSVVQQDVLSLSSSVSPERLPTVPVLGGRESEREQNANNLLADSGDLEVGVRERLGTLVGSMPAKFRYDPDVIEAHQFLAEACSDMGVLLGAVRECKAAGDIPFARNVRKRLPQEHGGMVVSEEPIDDFEARRRKYVGGGLGLTRTGGEAS